MLEMVAALVVVEEQVELMFHTPMHKQELEQVLMLRNHHVQVLLMVGTQDLAVKKLQVMKMSERYKFFGMELRYMMELMQMQI